MECKKSMILCKSKAITHTYIYMYVQIINQTLDSKIKYIKKLCAKINPAHAYLQYWGRREKCQEHKLTISNKLILNSVNTKVCIVVSVEKIIAKKSHTFYCTLSFTKQTNNHSQPA